MATTVQSNTQDLFQIDHTTKTAKSVPLRGNDPDFVEFMANLVKDLETDKYRVFRFKALSTEVASLIKKSLENPGIPLASQVIANRLINVEIAAQKKYEHITSLQKGSLLIADITYHGNDSLAVVKLDYDDFLDSSDLTKHLGLSIKKRTLKSCVVTLTESGEIDNLHVMDSNAKIADYWTNDFLEALELNTDEKNSQEAFTSIEHHLAKRLKKSHPGEYSIFRNNLVGYFKTSPTYNTQELIKTVIGSYKKSGLDIVQLKKEIAEIPKKKGFDEVFNIQEDVIKARYKRIVHLTDDIDLKIKTNVEHLKEIIKPFTDNVGHKWVQIRSDEGYDAFNI